MDKTKIKSVSFNHERKALTVEFKDGSMYGEIGNAAQKTFEQLNDNNIEIFETNSNEKANNNNTDYA